MSEPAILFSYNTNQPTWQIQSPCLPLNMLSAVIGQRLSQHELQNRLDVLTQNLTAKNNVFLFAIMCLGFGSFLGGIIWIIAAGANFGFGLPPPFMIMFPGIIVAMIAGSIRQLFFSRSLGRIDSQLPGLLQQFNQVDIPKGLLWDQHSTNEIIETHYQNGRRVSSATSKKTWVVSLTVLKHPGV